VRQPRSTTRPPQGPDGVVRRHIEERYGNELFITSVLGDSAFVFPLPVWEEREARLQALPSTDPVKSRYLERVSYYGQQTQLDGRPGGDPADPARRRRMEGDVVVSARLDHLVVWNADRLRKRFAEQPFTDDDLQVSERSRSVGNNAAGEARGSSLRR
jgi:MraZ protein